MVRSCSVPKQGVLELPGTEAEATELEAMDALCLCMP